MNVVHINGNFGGGGGTGIPLAFIVIMVIAVLVWLIASILTAQYAASKGYPFWPVFLASLFISFPVVLLVVALVPPREPPGASPPQWRQY